MSAVIELMAELQKLGDKISDMELVFNDPRFFQLNHYSMDQFGFGHTDEWRAEFGGMWWSVGINMDGRVKWFQNRDRDKAIRSAAAFIESELS